MHAPIHLRHATLDDLPSIVDIYNSTVASRMVTADLEPVGVADRLAWFKAHSASTRPLWVASTAPDAQEIAGWVSLSDFYGRPAYASTVEISVYIAASARGRGLGTTLVEHAVAAAPALGVATLLALVFRHNEPSLRLFRARGFDDWGCLPRVAVLDGVERDLTILGRRVAAPST